MVDALDGKILTQTGYTPEANGLSSISSMLDGMIFSQ
jgi:hypothetical protein